MKFPKLSKKTLIIIAFVIVILAIGIYVLTKNKKSEQTQLPNSPSLDNTSSSNSGSKPKINQKSRAEIINSKVGDIGKGYQIYLLEKKTATRFNDNVLNYLKSLTIQQIKDLNKMSLDELKRYASRIL